jgi:hypothetical protein
MRSDGPYIEGTVDLLGHVMAAATVLLIIIWAWAI